MRHTSGISASIWSNFTNTVAVARASHIGDLRQLLVQLHGYSSCGACATHQDLGQYLVQLHGYVREGANKRGNSSRLTQSFHFFMFEPIFSPVNALNQPI